MIQKGEFPHLKMGKSVRILKEDLLDWIDSAKEVPL
jgi:excisionase family DNA binding protein